MSAARSTCIDCSVVFNNDNYRHYNKGRCTPCFRKYMREYKRKRYHENKEFRQKCVETSQADRKDPIKKATSKATRELPENVERRRARRRELYKTDMAFKLKYICRARVQQALKNANSSRVANSNILLGISVALFKKWIESQFTTEMTWENHGDVWHIDHVRPCASFDLSDPERQKECFSWRNQQPLLKDTNYSKHDVVDPLLILRHQYLAADFAHLHKVSEEDLEENDDDSDDESDTDLS